MKKGKIHHTASRYTMTFVKPGYTPGTIRWKSIGYRCDDTQKRQSAGCVIPRYTPTLTTMRTLPNIAANIRRIQNNGPGHYGRPGSGHPLHKLTNAKKQRSNRNAVCGRHITGPPPAGKSCDEYPFASSYEGGRAVSANNRGWAWVPEGEQSRQGNRIATFGLQYRVLDKDAFWVSV